MIFIGIYKFTIIEFFFFIFFYFLISLFLIFFLDLIIEYIFI